MKLGSDRKFAWLAALAGLIFGLGAPQSEGATIVVGGFLEGDALLGPEEGDTMDYYVFEVLSSGMVRIDVPRFYAGPLFLLAEHIGRQDEFGFLGHPFRIEPPGPCMDPTCQTDPPIFLERLLPTGTYVFVTSAGGRSSYDVFDGFVPVNREGGGFTQAPYQYSITGAVRGLEYWDGHLDGTFTVTRIPEPSAGWLVLAGLGGLWRRRRNCCGGG